MRLCAVLLVGLLIGAGCSLWLISSASVSPVQADDDAPTALAIGVGETKTFAIDGHPGLIVPSSELAEPPMDLGQNNPTGEIRSGMPVAPPTGDEEEIVYRLKHPQYVSVVVEPLESQAVVDVATRAPLKEIFPSWVVVYNYETQEDKGDRVPTSFTVYRNTGDGRQGEVVNQYQKMFVDPHGLDVFYEDSNGREKQVPKFYFEMMPDPNPLGIE